MNQLQYRLDQEILKTNKAILALAEQGGSVVWQDYLMLISSIITVFIAIVVPFYIFKRQRLFELKMLELQKDEVKKTSIIRLIHHTSSVAVKMYSPLLKLAYVPEEANRSSQITILKNSSNLLMTRMIEIDSLRAELQVVFNNHIDVRNVYVEFYERYKLSISKSLDAFKEAKQSSNIRQLVDEYDFENEAIEVKQSGEKLINKLTDELNKISHKKIPMILLSQGFYFYRFNNKQN